MNQTAEVLDSIHADLNDQQRAAAQHGLGPLLIVAGAGTGKTTTLAHRVAQLIATDVDPGRILLLTFTRRAAAEMLRRVDAILRQMQQLQRQHRGKPMRLTSRKIWGGTFHAIATRLLRQHGKLIGLEPEFTILDRSDSEDLMHVVRAELELAKTDKRFPLKGTCMAIYSRCVNSQMRLERVLEHAFPWCVDHAKPLKKLFQAYVDRKERQISLDYDDLLLFWNSLTAEDSCAKVLREKFDYLLVDEYQDTNVLQSQILKHLCPDGQGLNVVGDDAQSIYSFRSATVRNILDFPKAFPGTTIVTLEENYRSTQPILDATNRVIAHAAERHTKNLWSSRSEGPRPAIVCCMDEDEQTDFVIDTILAHRETGTQLQQQAVLFRASHHSLGLEVELARRNIPFHKYGGLKFIETAHVKDLMAFLRLADNPRDVVSAMRVLVLLSGIGQVKASQLTDMLAAANWSFKAWDDYTPPAAAEADWPAFVKLMKVLTSRSKNRQTAADVHQVRKFYAPLLEQKYDHAQSRLRDLEQLEVVASRFSDRTSFLAEITLDPPSSTQELADDTHLDEDFLILSTIHSAKGLEWDSVFVLHAADGNIPSDMSVKTDEEVEEERRLFYVALTRAKNRLFVCHPQRYYFHGRYRSDAHSFSQLTRFMPEDVQQHFDRIIASGEIENDSASDEVSDVTTADIRDQIKRIWE